MLIRPDIYGFVELLMSAMMQFLVDIAIHQEQKFWQNTSNQQEITQLLAIYWVGTQEMCDLLTFVA